MERLRKKCKLRTLYIWPHWKKKTLRLKLLQHWKVNTTEWVSEKEHPTQRWLVKAATNKIVMAYQSWKRHLLQMVQRRQDQADAKKLSWLMKCKKKNEFKIYWKVVQFSIIFQSETVYIYSIFIVNISSNLNLNWFAQILKLNKYFHKIYW